MRRFIEKLIIIVLSLYFSYLDSEIDLVFYLLISLIISMSLDLFAFKKIRYVLYFLFIVLIFYDNIFLYYFPLILYNMYIDFKKTFFLFLPLLFMNLNILIVVLSFISIYLSISTDRLNEILIQNRSVRDKLKEDTLFLRKYNEQLKVDEEKNIQIALLEERNRIARELHDSIGHTISSSIIQLKALKLIKNGNLVRGLDALGKNLSTGMDDIRSNLYNLRNESIDLEYNINEIIDETIGLNINLTYNIDCDLDYKLKYDILAAVKEAINNTLKHSSADSMDIKILNQPKFYSIIINDNGTIYDYKKDSDDGIGLYSMEKLAKKYKGIFNYRFEDGFRLHLTLMKGNKI
ncbi:MAG: sensor histidine kinase [Senegalia sp. (in: firmicutes)]